MYVRVFVCVGVWVYFEMYADICTCVIRIFMGISVSDILKSLRAMSGFANGTRYWTINFISVVYNLYIFSRCDPPLDQFGNIPCLALDFFILFDPSMLLTMIHHLKTYLLYMYVVKVPYPKTYISMITFLCEKFLIWTMHKICFIMIMYELYRNGSISFPCYRYFLAEISMRLSYTL